MISEILGFISLCAIATSGIVGAEKSENKNTINQTAKELFDEQPRDDIRLNDVFYYNCESYYENSEQTAHDISPVNYYEYSSYTSSVSGVVNGNMPKYMYFKALTDSRFSLSFSFNDSNNYSYYDFYVYYYDMHEATVGGLICDRIDLVTNAYYCNNIAIKPGTYFISIMPKSNVNIQQDSYYALDLDVMTSNINHSNASIKDMMFHKKLGGAIWISDYNPLSLLSIDRYDRTLYYKPNTTNLNHPNYALFDLRDIASNKKINVSTLYVWDNGVKEAIRSSLVCLSNKLSQQCQNYENVRIEKTVTYNSIENSFEVAFFVFDMASSLISGPVSIVISFGTTVLSTTIDLILDSLIPDVPLSLMNYLSKINQISASLENSPEYEVVAINKFYNLIEENSLFPNMIEEYIDYDCIDYSNASSFIYTNDNAYSTCGNDKNNYDIIYSNINDQNPNINERVILKKIYGDDVIYGEKYYNIVRGKIYGIPNYDSLQNIDNLTLVENLPNTEPNVTPIQINSNKCTDYFSHGEYKWYSFTANSSGNYYVTIENSDFNQIELDLFDYKAPLYSYTGLIKTYTNDEFYIEDGEKYIILNLNLQSNQTIYIRVHAPNFVHSEHSYYIWFTNYQKYPNATHVHVYSGATYVNGSMHKYVCNCGHYYKELHHATVSQPNFCYECGRRVSRAILDPNYNIEEPLDFEDDDQIVIDEIIYYIDERHNDL